jgi:DNA-directed RNA polymerase specialized sigma24 family protein
MNDDPRLLELLESLEDFKPVLKSLLRRSSLPADVDDDIFQELALAALTARFPVLNPRAYFSACFRRIKARHWKAHAQFETYDLPDLVKIAPTMSPPQAIAVEARRLLASLPPHHAQAVYLRYVLEYSPLEIAARLGWANGTPRKSLRRLRARLQSPADGAAEKL